MAIHEDSQFKLNGTPVAPPLLGKCYSSNSVKRAYNDTNGNHIYTFVCQKDKFIWRYEAISADELAEIENIIKTSWDRGVDTFNVTSFRPGSGFVTVPCYCGGTIDYEVIANDEKGVPSLFNVEYHFIQIPGRMSRIQGEG